MFTRVLTSRLCYREKAAFTSLAPVTEAGRPDLTAGMNEVNDQGYGLIHQSVVNNYAKSVEKFIKANSSQLEFETQDGLHETPLLIAVRTGISCLDTIKTLQALGGKAPVLHISIVRTCP